MAAPEVAQMAIFGAASDEISQRVCFLRYTEYLRHVVSR